MDGDYWTKASKRPNSRANGPVQSSKQLADQKILTRLCNLIEMVDRMQCAVANCQGTLAFTGYMPNAYCLQSKCLECGVEERIQTARLFTLRHSEKLRQLPDLPYLMAVATRLLPGGGSSIQSRLNANLGLPMLGHTSLLAFYQGPLVNALKEVHAKSISDHLPAIKERAQAIDPESDGVNKFYPVSVRVDARWDKCWGWNALNSTIRMIESEDDLVLVTVTLHRKESSENRFAMSAKACDSEGATRCLIDLTKQGFDVVEVVHDDDASTMKKLLAKKAELALMPEYIGKISPEIKESLCTRYVV